MPLIGLRKLRHGWPIKMTSDSSNNVLKLEISKIMKSDLYNLIRRYCNSYKIVDFSYELFLHDFTKIEYEMIPILELEKLISLINKYWSYFSYLVTNLSFDEERITVERCILCWMLFVICGFI